MKKLIIISSLIFTILFSGCGGSGHSNRETAVENAPSATGPSELPNMKGPLKPPTR